MEGKYKAWTLAKFKGDPKYEQLDHRPLNGNELLVKIKCATIHPADLAFAQGTYGIKPSKFPVIPGMEGSGEIVQVGDNIDKNLIGKRAAVTPRLQEDGGFIGVWAEYKYCTLSELFIIDFELPYEQICFIVGNPFTAYSFVDTLRKMGKKSVVQNGASSAFGKIFSKVCVKEGIELINVVRKESHFETFQKIGVKHMISTSDNEWKEKLTKLCEDLNVTVAFDCVGGGVTGDTFACLPNRSTLFHFGNLELARLGRIDTKDLSVKEKVIRGFWLYRWLAKATQEEIQNMKDYVLNEVRSGTDTFNSEYSKEFSLDNFVEGLTYYLGNMTAGKVIIKP